MCGVQRGVRDHREGPQGHQARPDQDVASRVKADGEVREGPDVVEITGLLDQDRLGTWPAGMRVIVRRERPIPRPSCRCSRKPTGGATRRSRPTHDHRTAGLPRGTPPSPRPGQFPSQEFTINQTWMILAAIAADLVAWLRLLALDYTVVMIEPKALCYRLLHVPARLVRTGTSPDPQDPRILALGPRPDRRVRPHRRDPTTRLPSPSIHDPMNRRPAARQRQLALIHARSRHRDLILARGQQVRPHERPGFVESFGVDAPAPWLIAANS